MKSIKTLALAAALLATTAFAYAETTADTTPAPQAPYYNCPGYGPGAGFGGGYGPGMMRGGRGGFGPGMRGFGPGANQEFKQLTKEEATEAVAKYIAELKGYKLVEVTEFVRPRGTMYQAKVKDAGGNEFYFHVNPWGNVVGPFSATAPQK